MSTDPTPNPITVIPEVASVSRKRITGLIKELVAKARNSWFIAMGFGATLLAVCYYIVNSCATSGLTLDVLIALILFSALASLPIFIVLVLKTFDQFIKEILELFTQNSNDNVTLLNNCVTSKLDGIVDELHKSSTRLNESLEACGGITERLENYTRMHSECFDTSEEYYDYIEEMKAKACALSGKIYLTSFSTIDEDSDAERVEAYLAKEMEYCADNPAFQIQRIITIHSSQKLEKYKKFIEQAKSSQLKNWRVVYLFAEDWNKTTLPDRIGVQILSNEDIILLDPRVARICHGDDNEYKPIRITCSLIAKIFTDYYRKWWDEICNSNGKHGYILYDGRRSLEENNTFWSTFEENMKGKQKWWPTDEQPLTPD